jgi:Fic family protein
MEADIKPDISTVLDRDERIALVYPLVIDSGNPHRGALVDLGIELVQKSAGFSRSLPLPLMKSLAEVVRAMNCYYSNLIEGHDTHPIDIERALRNDYSADPRKRDLQHEATAHIAVQHWIDGGGLAGGRAITVEGIREIHRRFGELLPPELLTREDPVTFERVRVIPGELRGRDVQVGAHVAVSAGAVPRFLKAFEETYSRLGKSEAILAMAAAHHRLLWIHPFLDGNGRVARLMSHAMALELLDTRGVWSVARGLARNVGAYKGLLSNCDLTRRNDLDGRGTLSEEALVDFTRFFLKVSIDQVEFLERLVQPDSLRARILLWVEEEVRRGELPDQSGAILEAILYRGELLRADAPIVTGTGDRQSRRIVSVLLDRNIVFSEGPRAPLRLAFPAALASRWLPGLFPDPPK